MRHLVVDGYNVLHGLPRFKRSLDQDLQSGRDALIAELAGLAVHDDIDITVVFDAHSTSGSQTGSVVDGVRVIFGSKQQTADHVIERLAQKASREGHNGDLVVATDDRLISDVVSGMKVPTISVSSLDADLLRTRGGIDEARRSKGGRKFLRVEDGLDAKTREGLQRMLRGHSDT